jgi:hypothetical protein
MSNFHLVGLCSNSQDSSLLRSSKENNEESANDHLLLDGIFFCRPTSCWNNKVRSNGQAENGYKAQRRKLDKMSALKHLKLI